MGWRPKCTGLRDRSIRPVLTPVQAEITKQQLLRPPVVNQTRPMEGYDTVVPRRLRRGREVQTADDPMAVDARQISAASETVAWEIHRKSQCVMTVAPTSAAVAQADCGVVQPRPQGYGYTNFPPSGEQKSRTAQDRYSGWKSSGRN